MPLTINFGQKGVLVPRVLSSKYRYTCFQQNYELGLKSGRTIRPPAASGSTSAPQLKAERSA